MRKPSLTLLATLAASGVIALSAAAPAVAGDTALNLGPVGPREPILVKMGDKRLVAYYEPNGGNCFVSAVLFDASPNGGGYASTRFRVALHPGELLHVDGTDDRKVMLLCTFNGDKLMVLNRAELSAQPASNVTN